MRCVYIVGVYHRISRAMRAGLCARPIPHRFDTAKRLRSTDDLSLQRGKGRNTSLLTAVCAQIFLEGPETSCKQHLDLHGLHKAIAMRDTEQAQTVNVTFPEASAHGFVQQDLQASNA